MPPLLGCPSMHVACWQALGATASFQRHSIKSIVNRNWNWPFRPVNVCLFTNEHHQNRSRSPGSAGSSCKFEFQKIVRSHMAAATTRTLLISPKRFCCLFTPRCLDLRCLSPIDSQSIRAFRNPAGPRTLWSVAARSADASRSAAAERKLPKYSALCNAVQPLSPSGRLTSAPAETRASMIAGWLCHAATCSGALSVTPSLQAGANGSLGTAGVARRVLQHSLNA